MSDFTDGFRAGWRKGFEAGYEQAAARAVAAVDRRFSSLSYSQIPYADCEAALIEELERRAQLPPERARSDYVGGQFGDRDA